MWNMYRPYQKEIALRTALCTSKFVTRTVDIQSIYHSFGKWFLLIPLENISKHSDFKVISKIFCFLIISQVINNISRKLVDDCTELIIIDSKSL